MNSLNFRAAMIAREESRRPQAEIAERINNRGARVDEYLRVAGTLPNDPDAQGPAYCGMFVFYCYAKALWQGEINPLPRKVFSASRFHTWANANPERVVYRAGGPEPALLPGDVFVIAKLSHVGMVVEPIQDFSSGKVKHGFISVEGNQASPELRPDWGIKGVREKHILLSSCALIYRP